MNARAAIFKFGFPILYAYINIMNGGLINQ
jgi:hypothetical protein